MTEDQVETIAREFHYAYERLAPDHDYRTRPESRTGWSRVPDSNRRLMKATVRSLATDGYIEPGARA